VRRVPFSRFARPDSFSAVPGASSPVFTFCAPGIVFGGSEGVGSRFHVLRSRTHFRRYRGHRVPFSRFALPDSFSGVSRASGPVFKFYAPGLIFNGNEGVGSRFHFLRSRTRFRRYRGRQVLFSRFALPGTFSAVPGASGPVFTFCAPKLIFGCSESVGSRFHVLRSRNRFQGYRGRLVPFSSFTLPDSFSTVTRASGSRFHVLRSRTRFRRYRGRQVLFSRFALPGTFSAVPGASGPVFTFCTPGLIFGDTGGVESRFLVLRPDSFSVVPRASLPVFMFCAPGLVFDRTMGVGSGFHVSRSGTRFRRYRGCRVSF
jgi:hypothetical protein